MSELVRAAYSCFSYSVGRRGLGNVTGSLPGELDFHAFDISPLSLCVLSLNDVTVGKYPFAGTLRLVLVELAFEVGAVRVDPLSRYELAIFVDANIFLSSLEDDVGSFAFFVSVCPVARVNVRIYVGHDTFTVAVTVLPVTVVVSYTNVLLHADAVLLVAVPLTAIGNGSFATFGEFVGVGVDTATLSNLVKLLERVNINRIINELFLTPSLKSPV